MALYRGELPHNPPPFHFGSCREGLGRCKNTKKRKLQIRDKNKNSLPVKINQDQTIRLWSRLVSRFSKGGIILKTSRILWKSFLAWYDVGGFNSLPIGLSLICCKPEDVMVPLIQSKTVRRPMHSQSHNKRLRIKQTDSTPLQLDGSSLFAKRYLNTYLNG